MFNNFTRTFKITRIIFSLFLIKTSCAFAYEEYISGEFNEKSAQTYTETKELSIRYLAQRDLQPWLKKVPGKLALDYGSGLGFSVDFLLKQGFKVDAVDINPDMIAACEADYPQVRFVLHDKPQLPYGDNVFDLVYSSWVLFEIQSLQNIINYLKDAKRVMQDNGYFIAIIASSNMYDPKYQSNLYETNFSENYNAASGSLVKMKYREIDMVFKDYFWLESDYRNAFSEAGLQICEMHYPLGRKTEAYQWRDELHRSPVLLILAAKNCA